MLKVVEVFEVMQLSLVTLQHRKAKQARKQIKVTEERRDIEKEKNERQGVMTHILREKTTVTENDERHKKRPPKKRDRIRMSSWNVFLEFTTEEDK